MRKNDVIYALMSALVKSNQGNGAARSAARESAPAEKYSPIGKQSYGSVPGFDWQAEERIAYEPVDEAAGMWGEEDSEQGYQPDEDFGWVAEEEYAAEKRPCYCPPKEKEKKCHCQPWPYEEKWICTKQSRVCCEPIKCEKKKDPCHKDPCHKAPYWNGLH